MADAGRDTLAGYARAGVWLLPAHALLLALGTITHEPDRTTAFDDYARYVTTDVFLVSHLVASIVGAALGVIGTIAALGFLVRGPAAGLAAVGTALTAAGNVLSTAIFGAAAFAQPAIGRVHLRGSPEAPAIDADVYGAPLVLTAITGLLLLIAGAIAFGLAVARSGAGVRRAGIGYVVFLPLFAVSGFVFSPAQPIAAVALAVAAAVIARRLPATATA